VSEQITVATVGAAPSKVVVDKASPEPVDATGAGSSAKSADPPVAPKTDGEVPAGQDSKDPNLGRAFAALARKDQALRNREQQVQQQATQVKAVSDAIQHARDKRDPTALLELAGITPGELTDLLLAVGKEPTEADRLAKLEAARVADEKAAADARTKADAAALERTVVAFKAKMTEVAKAAGDKFELTISKGDDGIDLAYEIVRQTYETDGKVLPLEEALAKAEGHYDSEAKQYLSTKKYGASTPAASSDGTGARASNAPDTLTNNHVSGGPPAVKRPALTREESISEAARLMESRGWGKR
jgi:hypothetical protein